MVVFWSVKTMSLTLFVRNSFWKNSRNWKFTSLRVIKCLL